MIRPYRPQRHIQPRLPASLDIEAARTGDLLDIGWCHEADGSIAKGYHSTWEEWVEYVKQMILSVPKEERAYYRTWFAHYGAGFDWLHLVRTYLDRGGVLKMKVVMGGRGTKAIGIDIVLDKAIGTLRLRDSYHLIPVSLRELGEMYQLPFRKSDLEGQHPEDVKRDNPALYYDYLMNDVLTLAYGIKRFHEYFYNIMGNIGPLSMTMPAHAHKMFRMGLTEPTMTTWSTKLKGAERAATHGGLVLALNLGWHENIRTMDVRSMYPSVMRNSLFPVSYHGAWTKHYQPGKVALYRIRYRQPWGHYPPFVVDEQAREPRLVGEGWVTSPEVERLLEIGSQVEIIEGYVYTRVDYYFRQFMTEWGQRRVDALTAGDKGLATTIKLMLNSLFGKTIQREESWTMRILTRKELQKLVDEKAQMYDYNGIHVVGEEKQKEHTFCIQGALVTAYARVRLHRDMCEIIDNGGKVLYCDTDSIHYSGDYRLPTGNDIGQYTLEFEGTGIYLGKKLYALFNDYTEKIVHKGISRIMINPITVQTIGALALRELSHYTVEFDRFPTVREVIIAGFPAAVMVRRRRTIRLGTNGYASGPDPPD